MALRERGRLAALLTRILDGARSQRGWREPDARNGRTWRQLVLGVLVRRSTRLLTLGQAVRGQRRAGRAKASAQGLGYFLAVARIPLRPLSARVLAAAVGELSAARLASYRGTALVVIDPTDYAKRSRGRGRRGRQMQYVGRVRAPRPKAGRRVPPRRADVATSFG